MQNCPQNRWTNRSKTSQRAKHDLSRELRGGDLIATWLAGRGYAGMWLVQSLRGKFAALWFSLDFFALKIMEANNNKRRRIDEAVVWTRDDIVCCNCSELKSRHVHCPCSKCNGAAVARSVEHSHWQQQQQEIADIVVDRWEQANYCKYYLIWH